MLQPRTFLKAFRHPPLQRGVSTAVHSPARFPRLPQLHQALAQRSQQGANLQLAQKSISARSLWTSSWRNLKVSPLRNSLFRRYSDKPPQSLSERFKELSRKYGWAAVGVYLGLSVLDFPFCFMAVRLVGPDRIGELEHTIVDWFWHWIAVIAPSMRPEDRAVVEDVGDAKEEVAADAKRNKEEASIWTQLLLAYGLHKSLMIFRIPLTAAVTPKVVKTLRGWGWNIGPRVKKQAKQA